MTRDEIDALERALHEVDVPDEGPARERARRTVLAAQREVAPRRRSRPSLVWVAAAAVLAAFAVSQRDSGPARAFEKIVRDVVQAPSPPRPKPVNVRALPAAGRLLVSDGGSVWIVERDGKPRRLGPGRDATWSPRGLFVGVSAGHTLAALAPADGTARWTLRRDAPVSLPRWAPGGRHVAYRSGHTLRIVYGNGLHDVLVGERMAVVAPAWRPSDDHTLAWAATDGTVTVEDADTAKVLWSLAGGPVEQLAWSADGRRLLIAGRRHGALHDITTGRREPLRLPAGSELLAAAFAPGGDRLALAVLAHGQTEVQIAGETALNAPGRLRDLQWSPDGRWLLAGWAGADHWLLVRASGQARDSAVSAVRHRFGAAERTRGWCC